MVLRLAPTPSRSPGLRDPLLTQLRSHSLCSSTRITRRGQSSEKNSKMPLSQQFAVCRESLNLAQNASGTWHDQLPFPISWAGSTTKKGAYKYSIDLFQEAVRLGEQNGIPDTPRVHYRLEMAYAKSGQANLVRQQFQQAVKISPIPMKLPTRKSNRHRSNRLDHTSTTL